MAEGLWSVCTFLLLRLGVVIFESNASRYRRLLQNIRQTSYVWPMSFIERQRCSGFVCRRISSAITVAGNAVYQWPFMAVCKITGNTVLLDNTSVLTCASYEKQIWSVLARPAWCPFGSCPPILRTDSTLWKAMLFVGPPKVSLLWRSGGACVVKWSRELCWQ
jgi:hypothetical protein